jgi:hypothetical protein
LGELGEVGVVEEEGGYPGGEVPAQIGLFIVGLCAWRVAPVPEYTDPVGLYGGSHPRGGEILTYDTHGQRSFFIPIPQRSVAPSADAATPAKG